MATDPGIYQRGGKRIFDVLLSAIALLLLSPLFLVIALLVSISSTGPIFYLQQRVGKDGRLFRIAKFRSMQHNTKQVGSPITWRGDGRVTPFGKVLRFSKLDELPQFWNVLKGEMSLVGPRPEVPRYVLHYTARQREVLSVRPGVTDFASIVYRNEEHLLSQSPEPERFYEEIILPHKLDLNLAYLKKVSLSYDLLLLARTLLSVFFHNRIRC